MTGTPLKNTRHEAFAQLIAQGVKQVDAYERAGYEGTAGHCGQHASRLQAKPEVARRIVELQRPAVEKTVITIEQLFATFLDQGTYDPSIFDEVKSPEDLRQLVDESTRRLLVKGWKYDRQGRFLLDLVDKEKALDRIARHLSFYNDTLKVDVGDFDKMLEAAERASDEADG